MKDVRMKYGIFEPNSPRQTFQGGPIYSIGEPQKLQNYPEPHPEGLAALKVKNLRKQLNLTLRGFAKLLGIDPRTLNYWELGKIPPSETALEIIAGLTEALNTTDHRRDTIINFVKNTNAVGGIAYTLVKLFDHLYLEEK
jgi:transcriptional regulator with XRE-family HTH domain